MRASPSSVVCVRAFFFSPCLFESSLSEIEYRSERYRRKKRTKKTHTVVKRECGKSVVKMAEHSDAKPVSGDDNPTNTEESQEIIASFFAEIIKSPVNLALVGIIAFLVYQIFRSKTKTETPAPVIKELPKIRRDFTVEELKKYDGRGPDGRVLVAVNGSVYDATRGARFYGPDGPYAAFGGRDASRGLATFSVVPGKDEYDDLSDLNTAEMNSILEWEEQFKEKYDYVGKLLKPGEAPTNYSDEEDEGSQQETEAKPKED